MKNKHKLRNKHKEAAIYINDDLTKEEREMQIAIRRKIQAGRQEGKE